jgi:spore germination protein GerM
MTRSVTALTVLTVVFSTTACGLGADDAPRTIAESDQRPLVDVSPGLVSAGTGRVYLERTDETGRSLLVAVARQITTDPVAVVNALLIGPTDEEQQQGLGSAIPPDTVLTSVRYTATDMVRVDLTDDILESTGDDLVSALAQIVFSLGELSGVERIDITVDGQAQDWPRGDGSFTSEPLTVYDYPGRASSSQPAYPGYVLPTDDDQP